MPTDTATSGHVTLRFLAAPTDAGQGGTVSGGRILEWIDKAGFACAAGWSGRYCVTAYVGNVDFHRPVHIGDLVEVSAQLVLTGRSSMTIVVDVASGNPRRGGTSHAFGCRIVFVALDDDSRSTEVPPWRPESAVLRAAQEEATRRMALRQRVIELVAALDWESESDAHVTTLRFLAGPTDVNWGGKVHGGILMRWIDETAFACASGWSRSYAISRFSGGVSFLKPVRIGDLVEIDARLVHTGRTSMHIAVRARSGSPRDGRLELAAQCLTVFVAIDDGGRPEPVPVWAPRVAGDVEAEQRALEFKSLRANPALLARQERHER
ncbi:MAG TPA: acyl-CoA thioesterase [Dermatophilaceae bacterium]|nr:acyl-CoA thioesterase [Dermatophilaceae bacterium]